MCDCACPVPEEALRHTLRLELQMDQESECGCSELTLGSLISQYPSLLSHLSRPPVILAQALCIFLFMDVSVTQATRDETKPRMETWTGAVELPRIPQ